MNKKQPNLPDASEYPKLFSSETLTKLQFIVTDINKGGGAVNYDYLNVFACAYDENFKPMDHITELCSSSGKRMLTLTPQLIDQMYDETILDNKARANANRK